MFFEQQEQKNRSINIIPLIDIIFLMLIFFMLATNFYQNKEVDLLVPKDEVVVSETPKKFLKINIKKNLYFFNDKEMTYKELSKDFFKIWKKNKYKGVIIFNNEQSEVENLINLLDILNKNKVSNFFFGEEDVYKRN